MVIVLVNDQFFLCFPISSASNLKLMLSFTVEKCTSSTGTEITEAAHSAYNYKKKLIHLQHVSCCKSHASPQLK